MLDTIALAKRLSQVSPYAARLEPVIHRVPDLMEGNDQLRPLWEAWCRNTASNATPRRYFAKEELDVLRSFFEYLYFSSDAFIRSVKTRR